MVSSLTLRRAAVLTVGVFVASHAAAQVQEPAVTRFAAKQFGALARLSAVADPSGGASVVQRAKVGEKTVGWVFRTDRLPPVVKGRNDQIATLVALGADGKVKAIEVVQHREDMPWYRRIKPSFFAQFRGLAADGSGERPDTVATATRSSKAIVDDVLGACAEVLKLAEVSAAVAPGDAAATPAAPPAEPAPQPVPVAPAPPPAVEPVPARPESL